MSNRRHIRAAGLTLIDQGVLSALNFATTLAVGRMAGIDELGLYSIAFGLLILAITITDAMVITPYMAHRHRFGPGRQALFQGSVLAHNLGFSLATAALLIASGSIMVAMLLPERFGATLIVLGAILPVVLLREFVRRLAIANFQPGVAVLLDGSVAVLQLGTLLALGWFGELTALRGVAVIGVANGLPLLAWHRIARPRFPMQWVHVKHDLLRNVGHGRWALLSLATLVLHLQTMSWLLAGTLGVEAAGWFAACLTIVNLSNPFVQGLSNYMMPLGAGTRAISGAQGLRRLAFRLGVLLAGSLALFVLLLAAFGPAAIRVLYGIEIPASSMILVSLGLATLSLSGAMPAYIGLWALDHQKANLVINAGALVLTPALAVSFLPAMGVAGAALAFCIGSTLASLVRWGIFVAISANEARQSRLVSAQ